MVMPLRDIKAAAGALASQVSAGIPLVQALSRMSQLQPSYAQFWRRAVQATQAGHPLSHRLEEIWPTALVSVVRAGEQSGKLEAVLGRIEQTVALQMQLRGNLMKLAYPAGMGLAGVAIFIAFMVYVLPLLTKSLGGKGSNSFFFQLSAWMSAEFADNWFAIAVGTLLGISALVAWLQTPEARAWLLELFLSVPVVKDSLRDMYFGLWAHYMALMAAAGIPTIDGARLTASVLPGEMGASVHAFAKDLAVRNKSMSNSADPAKLPRDDLRVLWWPFYIANAFIVAENTGDVDRELLRVAPSLIEEGVRRFGQIVFAANVVALALSAALITAPLGAYYTEIFFAIRQAGR